MQSVLWMGVQKNIARSVGGMGACCWLCGRRGLVRSPGNCWYWGALGIWVLQHLEASGYTEGEQEVLRNHRHVLDGRS